MDAGGFFRGTSAEQDNRFANKQKKLLSNTKFADELNEKVDMKKVKLEVIKPWIAKRVTEILGLEDDVLINYIFSLLEQPNADPKNIQISLTPFLERNVVSFMKELWCLLLSAQKSIGGIPEEFLKQKQEEVRKKKIEQDRIQNELKRKRDESSSKIEESDGGKNDRSETDTKENGSNDLKDSEENDKKRHRNNRSKSPRRDSSSRDSGSRTASSRHRHRSRSPRYNHDREKEREREREKQRDRHSSEKDEDNSSKKSEEKRKHRDDEDKDKYHHRRHYSDSRKDKSEGDSKSTNTSMIIEPTIEKKNEVTNDNANNNTTSAGDFTDQLRRENELRERALQSMQSRKTRKE